MSKAKRLLTITHLKQKAVFDTDTLYKSVINSFESSIEMLKPSEYVEKYRVMPKTTAIPGPYKFKNSPYVREILDRMHPDDPTRVVSVMKVPQTGLSAGVIENGIAWSIAQSPAPMMLLSGDEDLIKEMVKLRLNEVIESCGLKHKMQSASDNSKMSGDTMSLKEFNGGFLKLGSANKIQNYRQNSIMRGFLDDVDAIKLAHKIEGDVFELFLKRFTWFTQRGMTAYAISTPTLKGHSVIESVFNRSDQRYFNVPCPKCGSFITLETNLKKDGERFGLVFKVNNLHKLIEDSVEYRCQSCGEHFKEVHKHEILNNGIWVPTNEDKAEPYWCGYQLGGLILPPGTRSWADIARDFIACYPNGFNNKPDQEKLKVFVNQCEGKVFEPKTEKVKASKLQKNQRDYEMGTVPCALSISDGNGEIILLSIAVDVNGYYNDARLDYEIMAHSERHCTYSIAHGSIGTFQRGMGDEGKTGRDLYVLADDGETHDSGKKILALPELTKILNTPLKTDDGKEMRIMCLGLDVGNMTVYLRSYLSNLPKAIAWGVKGEKDQRAIKTDTEVGHFRQSPTDDRVMLVNVNALKDKAARSIDIIWDKIGKQEEHFMNFPKPTKEHYNYKSYFIEYEGEEKKMVVGSGGAMAFIWQKKTDKSRNHFWDCYIYNKAMAEIMQKEICKEHKVDNNWTNFVAIMKYNLSSVYGKQKGPN